MYNYVYMAVFLLQGIQAFEAPTASEMVDASAASVKFASSPQDLAKKACKDAKDFQQFPDKSKLPQKNFTSSEVKAFDGEDGRSLYLVITGKVYDVTDFADFHPAGPKPLQNHAGQDCSEAIRLSGMPEASYRPFLHLFCVGDLV